MAQLLPLAAASAVPATAGAAALAKGAALAGTASTSLATGLTAGATLGGGISAMPALSYAGANLAAPGIFSAATPALAGLPSAIAPTAGIFSQATPALAGLPSLAPTAAQAAPGLLQTAGMSPLGGMQSILPAGTSNLAGSAGSQLAGQAGNISNQMYSELANQFARPNLGRGFTQLGPQLAEVGRTGSATADAINKAAGLDTTLSRADLLKLQSGQVANTPQAINLAQQAQVGQQLSDVARAQKMAQLHGYESAIQPGENFLTNAMNLVQNPSMQGAMDYVKEHPYATAGAAYGLYNLMKPKPKEPPKDKSLIRPYEFERTQQPEAYAVSPVSDTSERTYFTDTFTPLEPYEAPGPEYKRASGGISSLAIGGPVEQMAAMNAVGANTGYPMAGINTSMYSNPMVQRPEAVNVLSPSGDAGVGAYSGEPKFAAGGISDLGNYSDGGRLLRGPGDGVSDSIPAVIGDKQPARLADGEFVIPARIVSELGNGSTEAGARKLYAMMDRVQKARGKTVGKNKVAANTRADKHLPA